MGGEANIMHIAADEIRVMLLETLVLFGLLPENSEITCISTQKGAYK